jgi:hypothetical protein
MLTDAGALALSFAVIRFVQRSGGEALTYGRRRAAVPAARAVEIDQHLEEVDLREIAGPIRQRDKHLAPLPLPLCDE